MERRLRLHRGARSASRSGTIRATVLIETLPGAFQMDEILWELREHSYGLNAGPLGLHLLDDQVLPRAAGVRAPRPQRREDDRAVHARVHRAAGADVPQARRVRDGRHGGADPVAQGPGGQRAGDRGGRARTSGARPQAGFDGTWVAHPDVVEVAREQFDAVLGDRPNQIDQQRPDVSVDAGAAARRGLARPARSPRRACATTSRSASSTSRSGSAGAARRGSTT